MCYSAKVKQSLKSLSRQFGAKVDYSRFGELFKRRILDSSIKVSKALELNFTHPENEAEREIYTYIKEYQATKTKEWEAELFKQRRRLADAQRDLYRKETKKALNEKRIAGNKVNTLKRWLGDLHRTEPSLDDDRIYPLYYAPIVIERAGELVVTPMRYHLRPAGKPAFIDKKFDGLYNARRDNLEGEFWGPIFGKRHGILVMTSFFENVARHDYEKRALQPGEKEENLVLHFNPSPAIEMFVPCIWDRWESDGETLESFAAITDDPPAEIAATGHDRCPIPLKLEHASSWLHPADLEKSRLYSLLEDKERFRFAHAIAA